jgi:hypothetical protein
MSYGKELILDLDHCQNVSLDMDLEGFCQELCELVDMVYEVFTDWRSEPDEPRDPKMYGCSAVQFIRTSNITIHVLPLLRGGTVLLNLFSCKDFDKDIVVKFCETYFNGLSVSAMEVNRL